MEKLKHAIGLAPSEMTPDQLDKLAREELARMNFIVDHLAPKKKARRSSAGTRKKKQKTISNEALDRLSKLTGVDIKSFMK